MRLNLHDKTLHTMLSLIPCILRWFDEVLLIPQLLCVYTHVCTCTRTVCASTVHAHTDMCALCNMRGN